MPREGETIPDQYLSQVAHEMRGSLNTILGWAEYLRGTVVDDQARLRAAETIIRHARQQSWMVTELVDTCRLASGTLVLAEAPLVFVDLVLTAIDAVRPLARAKSVSFHQVESAANALAAARVRGDSRRLTQAFTALLSNAVHFSPDAGTVHIDIGVSDDQATVVIRDQGLVPGQEALLHLFERERPSSPGAGSPRRDFRTGLSLARDIVTRHGGEITATTNGEPGLTFRVVLPLIGENDVNAAMGQWGNGAALNGPIRIGPMRTGAFPIQGVRVLLVDDEPDARDALVGILTHYGAVVRAAGSAADAVTALNKEPLDVLLADIGMPGEDGYDLIRSVRGLASGAAGIPAVAVTAFTSDADRRRALEAGFQVHLSKPVDPSMLVATVAALGRRRASVR
jgi:CheY-like chemotaxis protein